MGVMTYFDEDILFSLMSWPQVVEFEQMYDPENREVGRQRESKTDLLMFGYYIHNNVVRRGLIYCKLRPK